MREKMSLRLMNLIDILKDYRNSTDVNFASDKIPVIEEQKKIIIEMRKVLSNVIKCNQPDKFDAKLKSSRE